MAKLDGFAWEAAAVMPASGWKVWAGRASAEFTATANAEGAKLLGKAEQRVDFELTEKGAQLRVVVEHNLDPFGEPPPPPPMVPRKFVFDRPFFVFLWRDNADWPYFGAWIGDDSALEKFR